jgi:DNA primase
MHIITNGASEIKQDLPAQNTNTHNNPSNIQASADSAVDHDVITTRFNNHRYLDAKELKVAVSFGALLAADGHQLEQSGSGFKCRCPFHSDSTPSFSVHGNDAFAKCFGCGWHGDIFKYEMEFNQVEFAEACINLNEFVRDNPRAGRKVASTRQPSSADAPLSEKQMDEREAYAQRLENDAWIRGEICRRRFEKTGEQWNPDILEGLAIEGCLGWSGDSLVFMYPNGNKFRHWPEKEFIWEGSTGLWRYHMLHNATHVYLTESETDVIALLNAGFNDDGLTTVIAAPSATTFKPEWAPLFKDKIVTFCFDNDQAGEEGVKRIVPMLAPYAKQLRTVDLKEVA